MTYLNTTKGARAIHLKSGGHVLVDAGATAEISEGKVKRVAPGLVLALDGIPPLPASLRKRVENPHPLDHDADGRKGGSTSAVNDIKALRAAYAEKMGKRPFSGWDADEIRRRMSERV